MRVGLEVVLGPMCFWNCSTHPGYLGVQMYFVVFFVVVVNIKESHFPRYSALLIS
jgi:hypothetical protein